MPLLNFRNIGNVHALWPLNSDLLKCPGIKAEPPRASHFSQNIAPAYSSLFFLQHPALSETQSTLIFSNPLIEFGIVF